MVIASQPYRLRAPLEFKAQKVVAPLVRALGKGGRLLGIHSHGQDPGPGDHPEGLAGREPVHPEPPRHPARDEGGARQGGAALQLQRLRRRARAVPLRHAHAAERDLGSSIGTSTLFAAWNAAIYVAQIDDVRLSEVLRETRYLDATREVLQKHGSLWFLDESYVVSRKRD